MGNLEKKIQEIAKRQFGELLNMDALKRKLISNLQNYLRERQDFIASIPTMDPSWSAPFAIIENIFKPILGGLHEKGEDIETTKGEDIEITSGNSKCPNMFLLFDNILHSEGIRAGGIEFEIKMFVGGKKQVVNYKFARDESSDNIKYVITKSVNDKKDNTFEDQKLAIYLGTSGCQGFYS
ncbi:MAG: hypothetical protein ACUVQ3_03565, partial [bacterium]